MPVMGEVDLFLSLTRARVLAVTGTKGKTTTTALIGAILEAAGLPHAVGGNIGTPLIERVDELGPEDWAVLELSELQLPDHPARRRHRGLHQHRSRSPRPARLAGGVPRREGAAGRAERRRDRDPERRRPRLPRAGRTPVQRPALVRPGRRVAGGLRARRVGDGRGRAGAAGGRRPAARAATCSSNVLAAALAAPPGGCVRDRHRRCRARVRGRAASAGGAGGARRRALGERLAGHHPTGGHGRAGGVRAGAGRAHRRRPRQGPGLRRALPRRSRGGLARWY